MIIHLHFQGVCYEIFLKRYFFIYLLIDKRWRSAKS